MSTPIKYQGGRPIASSSLKYDLSFFESSFKNQSEESINSAYKQRFFLYHLITAPTLYAENFKVAQQLIFEIYESI